MPFIGLTLTTDRAARWLEAHPDRVDCLELPAHGFFARRSPYLEWLAAHWPILLRVPLADHIPSHAPNGARSLDPLVTTVGPRYLVRPLLWRQVGGIHLRRGLSPARTRASLARLATEFRDDATPNRTLVEPVPTPLSGPGAIDEARFLTTLCAEASCRLLVDVAALLAASRNQRFDPAAWLEEIPADLIAVVRIAGTSAPGGGWQRDAAAGIEPDAWHLLSRLVGHARPEVLLLEPRDTAPGSDALERDLARLRGVADTKSAVAASPERIEFVEANEHQVGERLPGGTSDPRVERPAENTTWCPAPEDVGAASGCAIAPDVALFVLDHEGVVVCTTRRELTQLNTAATFVWCLLEDGNGPDAIAREYTATFGVAREDAERHVGNILRHWFGRGFITAPSDLPADPTPLMTALAWLVTNPRLRALFHQDPAGLADTLGMTGEDRDLLLALDHEELEAQAAEEAEALALEIAEAAPPDLPAPLVVREPPGVERRYQLLTTTVALHAPVGAPLQLLDDALGHLEAPAASPDVQIELRPNVSGGWQLFEAGDLVTELRSDAFIVPAVKQLLRERAVERHPFLISVHAGVVAFGDDCVLLPALAGSGKTTLTAALVERGATYFSDEIALLDGPTMAVTPVPLSLTIKDGSIEPLRAIYPDLETLPRHVREDYVHVRYMPPPSASLAVAETTARPRWIVFPTYGSDVATALHAIDRPTALRRLLDESSIPPSRMTREHVESLVQWMRTVDCYELPFSSLETAVALIASLATSQPD